MDLEKYTALDVWIAVQEQVTYRHKVLTDLLGTGLKGVPAGQARPLDLATIGVAEELVTAIKTRDAVRCILIAMQKQGG